MIAIIVIVLCAACTGFGVGFVCGRGLHREEAEYLRSMREELSEWN